MLKYKLLVLAMQNIFQLHLFTKIQAKMFIKHDHFSKTTKNTLITHHMRNLSTSLLKES